MCKCPQIILIKNIHNWYDEKTKAHQKYRLGLPTGKYIKKVVQPSFFDSVSADDVKDLAVLHIDEKAKDYPFLTDELEKEFLIQKHQVYWNDTKTIIQHKYLYVPIKLKNGKYRSYSAMLVPCNHCEECINDYTRKVAWLIDKDMRYTPKLRAFYLTLTYDPQHLPTDTDRCIIGDEPTDMLAHCSTGFLHRKDLQDWLKRVRITLKRWYGIKDLKVAYCGEYGKQTCRPHYHVLLWYSENNASAFGYKYKGKKDNLLKFGFKSAFANYILYGDKVPPLNETFFRSLTFDLWGKCQSQAFHVETPRSEYALARYFTKYLLKSRSGLLPDEIAEDFAPKAVPMFFRVSCGLGRNWAEHNFNSQTAIDGVETLHCVDKNEQHYEYKVSLPRCVMNYVDSLRKEHDLPDVRNSRYLNYLKYQSCNIDKICPLYSENHSRFFDVGVDMNDEFVLHDPNLMSQLVPKRNKTDISINLKIQKTIFNDETYL